jgi:hypothetical protein
MMEQFGDREYDKFDWGGMFGGGGTQPPSLARGPQSANFNRFA